MSLEEVIFLINPKTAYPNAANIPNPNNITIILKNPVELKLVTIPIKRIIPIIALAYKIAKNFKSA